jgi:hypothetical protein
MGCPWRGAGDARMAPARAPCTGNERASIGGLFLWLLGSCLLRLEAVQRLRTRPPNPTDQHVGSRVRLRRVMLKMSRISMSCEPAPGPTARRAAALSTVSEAAPIEEAPCPFGGPIRSYADLMRESPSARREPRHSAY